MNACFLVGVLVGGGSEIGICCPGIEERIIFSRLNDEVLKRYHVSSSERLPQRVKEVIIYPRSGDGRRLLKRS